MYNVQCSAVQCSAVQCSAVQCSVHFTLFYDHYIHEHYEEQTMHTIIHLTVNMYNCTLYVRLHILCTKQLYI